MLWSCVYLPPGRSGTGFEALESLWHACTCLNLCLSPCWTLWHMLWSSWITLTLLNMFGSSIKKRHGPEWTCVDVSSMNLRLVALRRRRLGLIIFLLGRIFRIFGIVGISWIVFPKSVGVWNLGLDRDSLIGDSGIRVLGLETLGLFFQWHQNQDVMLSRRIL